MTSGLRTAQQQLQQFQNQSARISNQIAEMTVERERALMHRNRPAAAALRQAILIARERQVAAQRNIQNTQEEIQALRQKEQAVKDAHAPSARMQLMMHRLGQAAHGTRTAFGALTSVFRPFRVEASSVFAHLGPFSFRMGPGAALATSLAKGLFDVGKSAVSTAADFERLEIAFEVMTGSAERAKNVFRGIQEFAAVTPFNVLDVTKATQMFTAVGFEAETALEMVKRLGNVAAAMPDDMATNLNRVVRALSDMHAKGTVQAEEMTRQLANAGIPAWEALAQRIGVSVPRAIEMARAGMVSARDGIMAILDLANSPRFAGMQQRQAQTMLGVWSTLKDNLTFLMRDVGDALIKGFDLKGATRTITDLFGFLRSQIGNLTPAIEKIGTVFRAAFEVAVSMVKMAVEAFAGWTKTLDNSPAGLQKLREGVLEVMRGIAEGTVKAVTAIGNAAISVINKFREAFGPNTVLGKLAKWLTENGPAGMDILGGGMPGVGGTRQQMLAAAEAMRRRNQGLPPAQPTSGVTPITTFDNKNLLANLNKMFDNLVKGGPIFQRAATAADMLGLALGGAASNAKALTIPLGAMPKAVTDAVEKMRGPFSEFQHQVRDTARLIEQALPGAFKTAADAAGVALGGMAAHLLQSQQAVGALRLGLAQKLLDFERQHPLVNRGDVGAMQKGSAEAAAVVNRWLNDAGRQRDPQQRAAALLEQMEKHEREQKQLLERMARALEMLGVQ